MAGNQTSPNPLVGAVCVAEGKIIGEGFHSKSGNLHAEPEAIASVKDSNLLRKSSLYVTLEPCNHFGKTPPCTELIIQSGIPRVVIGCQDPSSKVNGSGIRRLKEAGISVVMAPNPEPFQHLIRHFSWAQQNQSAWATLKWAENQDRYIGDTGSRVQISGMEASTFVHRLRSEYPAILVGANTILIDKPKLNTRLVAGQHPVKIILDPDELIPPQYFHLTEGPEMLHLTKKQLPELCFQKPDLLLQWIYQNHQLNAVLVEGGAFVLNWFIRENAWNEIHRIQSGMNATPLKHPVKAPDISSFPECDFVESFGMDTHYHYSKK